MTTTLVKNVSVFDGRELIGPTMVVIDGGLIGAEPRDGAPLDGVVIDGSGMTLLPGLIDTHVHLDGRGSLEQAREWGVTTMLDMGSWPPSAVQALRGLDGLPDIRSSHEPASAPGGTQTTKMGCPIDTVVKHPDEAEGWVAIRVAEGADYIKIIVEDPARMGSAALDLPRIGALVAAAHARGLKTIAHATTADAIALAVAGGIDVVTHAPLDRPIDAAVVVTMAKKGIVSLPTLVMMQGANTAAACGCLGPHAGPTDYAHCRDSVTSMHRAGLVMLAGTDANTAAGAPAKIAHGKAMHQELALLVEAGLTPMDALRSATSLAAEYFGLDDRGVIAAGRRADLLLVDGDPTVDIAATRQIRKVWCGGAMYTPQTPM